MEPLKKAFASARKFVLKFNKEGKEIPDPRPVEIPAGMKKPETLEEQIRRLIRTDVSRFAEDHGAESFDDANDFDIEDEEPESQATHHELVEEVVDEAQRFRRERAAAQSRDKDRRRGHGDSEEEGGEEELQEAPARSPHRNDLPGSKKGVSRRSQSAPRSPQRRSTGRREDAEEEDDDSED